MTNDREKEKNMIARVIAPDRVDDVEIHNLRSGDRIVVMHLPEKMPTASAGADSMLGAARELFSDDVAILMLPHGATFEIVEVTEA